MAQILVRGLDDKVIERLKKKAKKSGRSLEAEVRIILEQSASMVDLDTARKIADNIRRELEGKDFSDSVDIIREGRDR